MFLLYLIKFYKFLYQNKDYLLNLDHKIFVSFFYFLKKIVLKQILLKGNQIKVGKQQVISIIKEKKMKLLYLKKY